MSELRIYGNRHDEDNLLVAFANIIIEAAQRGDKKCYIEQPPSVQNDYHTKDELYRSLSAEEAQELAERMNQAYALVDNGSQRQEIGNDFVRLLAARTGIELISADVGSRPGIRLEILKLAKTESTNGLNRALCDLRLAKIMEIEGCTRHEAIDVIKRMSVEVSNGTFLTNFDAEMNLRSADDPKVAEFIERDRQGASAFVIWGRGHLNLDEPTSLASTLLATSSAKVSVFDIQNGDIIPVSPARNLSNVEKRAPVTASL
ncbi:MAG: hypothetical protein WAO98_06105 [Alphaproteobacteria bacterium]